MSSGGRALQESDKKPDQAVLPLEERIRRRAHEIYEQRGGAAGSDFDDWLQAEQEILGSEPEVAE